MKPNKLLLLALSMIMIFSLWIVPASAAQADETANHAANILYELGLFRGLGNNEDGTPNFDLSRAPSREEAVTMMVRLLGKESAATSDTWYMPFTDVSDWAKPYVGYAYNNNLTYGISPTSFGGKQTVTAAQYLTFVLRALYYSSDDDFDWDAAWELSDYIGVTSGEYSDDTTTFTRGDIAMISESALYVEMKYRGYNLLTYLNNSGALAGSKLVLMDLDVITTGPNEISFAFFPIEGSPNTYSKFVVNNVEVNGLPCTISDNKTTPESAQDALSKLIGTKYPMPFNYTKAFNYTVLSYDEARVKAEDQSAYKMVGGDIFPYMTFSFECTGTLKDGSTVSETFSAEVFSIHGYIN